MKHRGLSTQHGVRRALAKAFLLGVALACAQSVEAVDRRWTGAAGDRLWSSASNWNPAGPPQNGDRLRFDNTGEGSIGQNDLIDLRLTSISGSWFYTIRGNGF